MKTLHRDTEFFVCPCGAEIAVPRSLFYRLLYNPGTQTEPIRCANGHPFAFFSAITTDE